MLDECDNAGVLHLDWELISFTLKEKFSEEEFKSLFSEKITYISSDKVLINRFITYQDNYNNPTMRKHIEKLLRSHGIWERYQRGDF